MRIETGSVFVNDLAAREGLKIKRIAKAAIKLGSELAATRFHEVHVIVDRDGLAAHGGLLAGLEQREGHVMFGQTCRECARDQVSELAQQIILQRI